LFEKMKTMEKSTFYYLSICLLLMMGCQPTTNSVESTASMEATEVDDNQKSLYAVPLSKAIDDIGRFDSLSTEYLQQIPIKAFTIRSIDFLEAMGVSNTTPTKYTHVRIYLGMDSSNNYKLFLTPVKGAKLSSKIPVAGKDVILNGPYQGKVGELQDTNGSYVLDFSQPCPSACDDGSPLNQQ
jgi:hypothetical protein